MVIEFKEDELYRCYSKYFCGGGEWGIAAREIYEKQGAGEKKKKGRREKKKIAPKTG